MKNKSKNSQRYSENNKKYVRKEYTDIYSNGEPNKHDGYVDVYSVERKREKKRSRVSAAKIISFTFFLIIGMIGSLMLYAYKTLHSFNYDDLGVTKNNSEITGNEPDPNEQLINDKMVLNVMLIGSDSMSVGDHGRSDSLLVVSLDIRHKKIKITSIMRDIWVSIPGYGSDRINAAYAYGGPKLSIETIEKNFGIYIDRYAVVDFKGFSKIIDTLGGIDLELTAAESSYINIYSKDKHTLKGSGLKHLTGLQALNYARDRNSIGSDYDRTMRQRNVIKAIVNKLKTANLAQITEIISALGPMVTTNFKPSEISRLTSSSLTYLNYPLEEFRLPTNENVRSETYDQKSVLVINNMARAKSDLFQFIYEKIAEQSPIKQTDKKLTP